MRYLGIDNCGGTASVGIFDSKDCTFTLRRFDFGGMLFGRLYHGLYKKRPGKVLAFLVEKYAGFMLNKLLKGVKDVDWVILASNSGSKAILSSLRKIEKKYESKGIVKSDHNWGYLNSVKYHPEIRYPALVLDASLHHSIVAYLPNERQIEIVQRTSPKEGFEDGLGHHTINWWVEALQEDVCWPGQIKRGKKQVYGLYKERGVRGKVVISLKEEIKLSQDIFCNEIFKNSFPERMESLRADYVSIQSFKDDWVASQWQLLRDVIDNVETIYRKKYEISSFFVSGGISFNPALQNKGWLLAPKELAGAQGAGCAMAYLGYCINEKGLEVNHEEWKDYLFP